MSDASRAVHREPTTRAIVQVWIALVALTAGEVVIAAAGARGAAMLALLLGLSAVKSALILGWFMHLRFERRSLALALLPIAIMAILLLSFVFPDSFRLGRMRGAEHMTGSERGAETR
jgi:caa(3)-type oxidase subunit IV